MAQTAVGMSGQVGYGAQETPVIRDGDAEGFLAGTKARDTNSCTALRVFSTWSAPASASRTAML